MKKHTGSRQGIEWGGRRRRAVALTLALAVSGTALGTVSVRGVSWNRPTGKNVEAVQDRGVSWNRPTK